MAQEWKCGEINTSEKDTDSSLSYSSSFNQVWSNTGSNGARIIDMIDLSVEPPRNFCMFFREILDKGNYFGKFMIELDGKTEINDRVALNPTESYNLKTLLQKSSNRSTLLNYLNNFNVHTRYYGTNRTRK